MPIVPEPLALIVRLVFDPESMAATATVPPVAAPVTLRPAACEAVEASTKNAGVTAPRRPTARADALAEVAVTAPVTPKVPPTAVLPEAAVTVNLLAPTIKLPVLVSAPPAVNSPVPVVIGPLLVVCSDSVLAAPKSKTEDAAPVRVSAPSLDTLVELKVKAAIALAAKPSMAKAPAEAKAIFILFFIIVSPLFPQ